MSRHISLLYEDYMASRPGPVNLVLEYAHRVSGLPKWVAKWNLLRRTTIANKNHVCSSSDTWGTFYRFWAEVYPDTSEREGVTHRSRVAVNIISADRSRTHQKKMCEEWQLKGMSASMGTTLVACELDDHCTKVINSR